MNKETCFSAYMRLIKVNNVAIIATFRDVIQPTLDPNNTEIL